MVSHPPEIGFTPVMLTTWDSVWESIGKDTVDEAICGPKVNETVSSPMRDVELDSTVTVKDFVRPAMIKSVAGKKLNVIGMRGSTHRFIGAPALKTSEP
jgi:hypothetical protein